jgi:prepilin-type N-terminal cleavage/methylation domain-containing protein
MVTGIIKDRTRSIMVRAHNTTHIKSGFTIVELLIVITILVILVVISAISYAAIQSRGKSSAAVSLAMSISRKAEAWESAVGYFPTYTQLSTNKINAGDATLTAPIEGRIEDTSVVSDSSTTNPTNEKKVGYKKCTTGAQVEYYDASAKGIVYIGVGGATSTALCS